MYETGYMHAPSTLVGVDKRGIFTVKSAYKVQRAAEQRRSTRGCQSSSGGSVMKEEHWKGLWKIKCSGKIKHFLWRMAHNSLALRMGLQRRGMEVDTRCVVCQRMNEDGGHLFFKCKIVKPVWRDLLLEEERRTMGEMNSARGVIEYILRLPEKKQLQVVTLLWLWWQERNRRREGEKGREGAQLAVLIAHTADKYMKIGRPVTVPGPKTKKKWQRPDQGIYKINCDGSFHADTAVGGWGYVIRNDAGEVVLAGAGHCSHLMDALHAELLACQEGIKKAAEQGMWKVIVETDSLLAKSALETNSFALASIGGIAYETKSLMNMSFVSCVLSFCPRECNQVAHALAAQGCMCSQNADLCWEGMPPGVENLVASDIAEPLS